MGASLVEGDTRFIKFVIIGIMLYAVLFTIRETMFEVLPFDRGEIIHHLVGDFPGVVSHCRINYCVVSVPTGTTLWEAHEIRELVNGH